MSPAPALQVTHETVTSYSARVDVGYHVAHLFPRADARQQVDDFELAIEPVPSHLSSAPDVFGNLRTCFALYVPHTELTVRASSTVSLAPRGAPPEPAASAPWDDIAVSLHYSAGAAFRPESEFSYASPFVPLLAELRAWAEPVFAPGRPCLDAALELMHRIHREYAYESGATEVTTPLAEVVRERRGVCQDFAHLMLGALRAFGLPARYVSGYLLTTPPAGQARLLGADASHAWISVWCPVHGWVDLDPTNDVLPDTGHVTLAVGRDFGDVTPLRGVILGGAEHTLEVAVSVVPAATADERA